MNLDMETGGELDRKFRHHAEMAEQMANVDPMYADTDQMTLALVHAQLATAYAIRHQTRTARNL